MKSLSFPKSVEAVFFDLDGTLIDSEPLAAKALIEVFALWGTSLPHSEAIIVTGKTWESACEYLFQKYPPPLEHKKALRQIVEHYSKLSETQVSFVPGSKLFIESIVQFRDQTLPTPRIALVSGSHRKTILWALKQLDVLPYFEFILGAEDYPKSKPAPDGYLKALSIMRVLPKNALVFEDSTAGIQSAKLAGIYTIAISCTNHFDQDVSQADQVIPDYRGNSWKKLTCQTAIPSPIK